MSFAEFRIAAGLLSEGLNNAAPWRTVQIGVEYYNNHQTAFGGYDETVTMNAEVYAKPIGGERRIIGTESNLELPPGGDSIYLISRFYNYTFPPVPEVEVGVDYTFRAPGQGTFEGSDSRKVVFVEEGDISISGCSTPSRGVVGQAEEVTAVVENAAGVPAEVDVVFTAAGGSQTETVTVPAEGTAEARAQFTFDTHGKYEVSAEAEL